MTVGTLVPAARSTHAKLMVLLPLTMALLVAGTGFFTLRIAQRAYELHGTSEAASDLIAQLGVQVAGISFIAALLGFSIALGVTKPVRQMVEQLEAMASGDLRGTVKISSTSEIDSLGGAVNDAISAIQRYYFQSMTGAVITLDAEGRVIGSSAAAEATLGYREEDLVGRRFSDVFTPASGSRASLTAVETAIAGRKPVSLDDIEILAADGRPVRIGITASYLQQRPPSTLREPQGRPEQGRGTTGSGQAAPKVPPGLLEEVFELNEQLDEIRESRESGGDPTMLRERLESARKPIDLKREEHEREVEALSARWDEQFDAATPAEKRATLDALRERLLERNYINNLLASIDRECAVLSPQSPVHSHGTSDADLKQKTVDRGL
jgi:PAS domain S-box-containing protein